MPVRPLSSETLTVTRLIQAGSRLNAALSKLRFGPPVSHVYNPLEYAWSCYEGYIRRFARSRKRVVFLGMNPGPFGMVQTGIPFGEVRAVREWLQLTAIIGRPSEQHPRRPVNGLNCERSEVSGQRLWGLFAERFGSAPTFFKDHFVLNYCPLAFMEATGRNRTPDKLTAQEKEPLFSACDEHLLAGHPGASARVGNRRWGFRQTTRRNCAKRKRPKDQADFAPQPCQSASQPRLGADRDETVD